MNDPGYILADDLSGALEAGAPFRVRGWRVVLPLGGEAPSGDAATLPVISTESRGLAPESAAAAVRSVLAVHREAGAHLLFKKIDSTLRGPLGAELRALVETLAPPLVVLCPAAPAAGRTVAGGVLHVDGVPLEQTAFRRDPAWPAVTGDIRARLAGQGIPADWLAAVGGAEGGTDRAAEALRRARAGRGQPCIVIPDAASEADLAAWVTAAREIEPAAIFVGSAALGAALAQPCPAGPVAAPALPASAKVLVLCGSRHPASHRQIEELARRGPATIFEADLRQTPAAGVPRVAALLADHRVVAVRATATADLAAGALTHWLAELAAGIGPMTRMPALVATGGETARAVCLAVGGTDLEIQREVAPGVVLAALSRTTGETIRIATKPGGYGDDIAMLRLVEELMK